MMGAVITLHVSDIGDFIARFGEGLSRTGILLPSAEPIAAGSYIELEVLVPSGATLFRAGTHVTGSHAPALPGMLCLTFASLTSDSQAFLDLLHPAVPSEPSSPSETEAVSLADLGVELFPTQAPQPSAAAAPAPIAPSPPATATAPPQVDAPTPQVDEPGPPPPPIAAPAPPAAPPPPLAEPPPVAATASATTVPPARDRRPPSSLILGIDLGTTYSCVAVVRDGQPVVIPTEGGHRTIPSVVAVTEAGETVGWAAYDRLATLPKQTIYGSKRLLGRKFDSPAVQEVLSYFDYDLVADEEGDAAVRIQGNVYSLTWVAARILEEVMRHAAAFTGERIVRAIVTVPAWYTDRQRQAVLAAGEQIGLEIVQIVNEPTAAAIAYGINKGFNQRIMVYDFGGGTFDVSVLELQGNVLEVIATGGDAYLGGVDFDNRMVDWMLEEFERANEVDLSDDAVVRLRLRQAAETAKRELSQKTETRIALPFLARKDGQPLNLDLTLTRDRLNRLVADLVDRSLEICTKVLADAHLKREDLSEVLFVGGQTRMPLIQGKVHAFTGKPPRKGVHPDEAVALGAALLAFSRDKIDSVTLLDVVSVPIGIGLPGGRFKAIIERNTKLPVTVEVHRSTTQNDQTSITLDVFQGEGERVTQNEFLGSLTVKDLPARPKGEVQLRIQFRVDGQGFLHISCSDNVGGAARRVSLATRDTPETVKEARAAAAEEERAAAATPARIEPAAAPKRGLLKRLFRR